MREVAGTKVDQVIVGSSVNSSFRDLMVAAKILEGRHVHPDDLFPREPRQPPGARKRRPGKRDARLSREPAPACMSPAATAASAWARPPGTGEISLRTFPRNFPGRSGTKDDQVYLCSPETATASALRGVITDPRDLAEEMAYPAHPGPGSSISRTTAPSSSPPRS